MTEASTINAPSTPFQAAFAKALKANPDAAPVTENKAHEPKTEKPPAKVESADDKKTGTPKELFKKAEPEPAKEGPIKTDETKSVVDDIASPDFKGDTKARAGWDTLKKEAKTWQTTAKANEVRAKEAEAKLAEYEALKTQLADRDLKLKEYDEIVARTRIEDHPEFRREFVDGRAKLITKAETIIEESGGDPKEVATALNLKGKARVEALRAIAGDLDNFQSGRLGRVIDELTDLDDRADAKRAKSKESYADLQHKERHKELETRTELVQRRKVEFEDTTRRLRGELEVLQKVDGYEEHNAFADRIVKEAQAAVEDNPTLDIEAEILARAFARQRDLFLQADKKTEEQEATIAELRAELKAIHGKSPSLTGRTGAPASNGSSRPFSDTFAKLTSGE